MSCGWHSCPTNQFTRLDCVTHFSGLKIVTGRSHITVYRLYGELDYYNAGIDSPTFDKLFNHDVRYA